MKQEVLQTIRQRHKNQNCVDKECNIKHDITQVCSLNQQHSPDVENRCQTTSVSRGKMIIVDCGVVNKVIMCTGDTTGVEWASGSRLDGSERLED